MHLFRHRRDHDVLYYVTVDDHFKRVHVVGRHSTQDHPENQERLDCPRDGALYEYGKEAVLVRQREARDL